MKNNTAFLKLSNLVPNNVTRIISRPVAKRIKKSKKIKPFLIVNTDNSFGLYAQQLLKELKKYSFEQQPYYKNKKLNKLRTNDIIVFGDSNDFDFRIETNVNTFEDFDDGNFVVYDLVNNFAKILKRLEEYVYDKFDSCDIGIEEDYEDSFVHASVPFNVPTRKANSIFSLLKKNPLNRKGNYNFLNKLRKKDYEEQDEIVIKVNVEEKEERPTLKRYAGRNRKSNFQNKDRKSVV